MPFESRKPVIYVHDIASGKRRLVATWRGSNSAPSWSPDGGRMLATLTLSGNSQVYEISPSGGGEPRRLSQSAASIPRRSICARRCLDLFRQRPWRLAADLPHGRWRRQRQRITFQGSYNISPAISPDGRWLAFISRIGGAFKLQVMELGSGNIASVTDTSDDERPSFAPQ